MGELRTKCVVRGARKLLCSGMVCAAATLPIARAEMVKAKFAEGTQHGYLTLLTEDGKRIGTGELVQVTEGDRVRVRLLYRLNDGSIDDERSVFTQKGTYRLLSDRHIQKGPSFPHPYDVSIDMAAGQVTTREVRDGQTAPDTKVETKAETKTMKLPEDLANGTILTLIKNIPPEGGSVKVSYLGALPKARLVELNITSTGEDSFRVGLFHRKAHCFLIKIDLGGIEGKLAPLVGKQPGDVRVWIEEGEAPAFIREEGSFYEGGPVWITEMTSPTWGTGRPGGASAGEK